MLGFGLGLNKWRRVGGGFVGLLDLYPNAAAAYSLRKLRAAYSGSAVRVRKEVSLVSSETDIGFAADGSLDTVSLLAFASDADSGDVFVVTWYDQSLSNDATQGTGASQPKIVSGGAVITEGTSAKPAVDFDGVDDGFTTSLSGNSTFDFYSVIRATIGNSFILPDNDSVNSSYYGYLARADTSTTIYSSYGTPSLYVNGALETPITRSEVRDLLSTGNQLLNVHQGADTSAWSYIEMFGRFGFVFDGTAQEIIIFNSDQSSNRAGIETNINTFYSIYP